MQLRVLPEENVAGVSSGYDGGFGADVDKVDRNDRLDSVRLEDCVT
jgi:hypothetical protein